VVAELVVVEGVGAVLGVDGAEISLPTDAVGGAELDERVPRGMSTTAATATAKTNTKPTMRPPRRRARFGSVAGTSPARSGSASSAASASATGTRTPISCNRMADGFLLLMRTGSGPA
jgi:hypothetical protein